MSHYEKKRSQDHTQAYEPAHKRLKSWSKVEEQPVKSANDRFAGSIYKGKTLITKTPQKIVFNDDAPSAEKAADVASLRLSRKKSVTFTPETKNEDGATGQNFSKMWLSPAATGQADSSVPDVPTPTKEAPKPADQPAKPKAPAQPKKSKKSKKPVDEHEARAACRAYLELFHKDHANWKFNKARQNDLLRHLWSIEAIPASYNDALVSYIKGLSGAAAQQRLADGIVKIIDPLLETHKAKLGDLSIDTPEQRRDAYAKVVETQRESLEDLDDESRKTALAETEQAERAALLMNHHLWTLLRPAPTDDEDSAVAEPADFDESVKTTPKEPPAVAAPPAPPVSKRKSRKTRTATYSSSESSSSDDSDSDSD